MFGGHRSTTLLLLGVWALVGGVTAGPSAAQPGPAPLRLQPTAEPPLAVGAPRPAVTDTIGPLAGEAQDPLTPVVSIQVNVLALAVPGQELEYKLVVENRSRAAAHHVLVKDKLPDAATYVRATPEPTERVPQLIWDLGTLAAGARKEISLIVKPTGAADLENTARVQFEHGKKNRTSLTKPLLRVREVGPAHGAVNDVLTYQLEVANIGSADATDVLLTDTLPDGLTFSNSDPSTPGGNPLRWNLGTIAQGQTRRVKYMVIAEKAGSWSTQVRATAGSLTADASSTVTVGEPNLSIITTGPTRRLVNRPAVYQITVSNTGAIPLTGVQVSDKIPADITFVSATAGGVRTADQVQWNLGAIPPGARKTLQLVLRSGKAGELTNVATVRADHQLQKRDAVLTTFEAPTTLAIEIEKATDPVDDGSEAGYTVHILNPTSRAAANVGVTITVPDEMRIVSQRGPTAGAVKGQKITFDPLQMLAPGGDAVYTLQLQATKPGAVRLKVDMTSDSLPAGAVVSQEENVTILQVK